MQQLMILLVCVVFLIVAKRQSHRGFHNQSLGFPAYVAAALAAG